MTNIIYIYILYYISYNLYIIHPWRFPKTALPPLPRPPSPLIHAHAEATQLRGLRGLRGLGRVVELRHEQRDGG